MSKITKVVERERDSAMRVGGGVRLSPGAFSHLSRIIAVDDPLRLFHILLSPSPTPRYFSQALGPHCLYSFVRSALISLYSYLSMFCFARVDSVSTIFHLAHSSMTVGNVESHSEEIFLGGLLFSRRWNRHEISPSSIILPFDNDFPSQDFQFSLSRGVIDHWYVMKPTCSALYYILI